LKLLELLCGMIIIMLSFILVKSFKLIELLFIKENIEIEETDKI